jgi:YegS/Rv2252/BmrU family lipid kinase
MVELILNPSAGGGRAGHALPDVTATLHRHGIEFDVATVTSLEHARERARAVSSAGGTAVAFGGDGLVGAIAGELRRTDGVLGVLPGGRGNDFARVLGIPLDPVAACDVLATGQIRRIDLGVAGGRTFVGVASCGFDSDANRIANRARLIRGRFVYTYAGIRALATWRPARFDLVIDGAPRSITGYTVAAANSSVYGGGMVIAPGAALDDGLLDLVLIAQLPRLRFLRLLPRVFRGEHTELPWVTIVRAREVEVRADRAFTMYADGDPIAELPVKVTVEPAAVRELMPTPARDQPVEAPR